MSDTCNNCSLWKFSHKVPFSSKEVGHCGFKFPPWTELPPWPKTTLTEATATCSFHKRKNSES